MSTVSPVRSIAWAARLAARGVALLDAPVSGGQKGAQEGTLSIMAGGPEEVFARCLPVLQAMGRTVIRVGANGHGLMTKLANQVTAAVTLLAAAECSRLLAHSGVDAAVALQAIRGGTARSAMLEMYPERMLGGDFAPGFRIRLMNKDLRLASEFAADRGIRLPGLERVRELLQAAEAAGLGDLGIQGVFKYMEEHEHAEHR